MAGPLGRFSLLASALAGLLLVVAFASIVQAAEPRWSRVTSPARTFTVELPQDWIIKPTEPDESTVAFMPSGRDLPSVGIIAWVTAGVLQAISFGPRAGDDPRLFCRQISAQELYTQILLPLVRQRAPDVRLDRMTPGATREAVAEASGTVQGNAVKALDVRGLMAALEAAKGIADRILSSFAPTPAWGANRRTLLFQGIETRLQMVGRTMSNIQRMQTDQALRELESSRRLGQRWIDTTGGVACWKDPGGREGTDADDLDSAGADALVALPARAERRRSTGVARLRLPRSPRAALRRSRRRNQPFVPAKQPRFPAGISGNWSVSHRSL